MSDHFPCIHWIHWLTSDSDGGYPSIVRESYQRWCEAGRPEDMSGFFPLGSNMPHPHDGRGCNYLTLDAGGALELYASLVHEREPAGACSIQIQMLEKKLGRKLGSESERLSKCPCTQLSNPTLNAGVKALGKGLANLIRGKSKT